MSIIKALIQGGRTNDEQLASNVMIPLSILCWLDDNMYIQSSQQYISLFEVHKDLVSYMPKYDNNIDNNNSNDNNNDNKPFINVIENIIIELDCNNIDEFIDFVDSFRNLFDADPNDSPNGNPAPTQLCIDSSLGISIYCTYIHLYNYQSIYLSIGIFARSFLARWDCLSFESVSILYEKFQIFISFDDITHIDMIKISDSATSCKKFPYVVGNAHYLSIYLSIHICI
jgi:hypothetical protein